MKGIERHHFLRNFAALVALTLFLNGCLSDEEASRTGDEALVDHELSGSVGDGPVVGAVMRVLRNDGVELAQLASDANAGYNIMVRTKGKYYPLSIDARNGTDLVTNAALDFQLWGAVLEPGKKSVANINPFSTFAVELARDLPAGISKANLATAQAIVSAELNNGLTSLVASGPMATRIDGSNIAEIVRASEALGETVRRTRDAMNASGFSVSADDIVRALSSDLIDQVVDGRGGPRSDARLAAVWIVVSAQVLLETMANEIHVGGVDATQAMTNAINQVSTESADPVLEDLTVTAAMLLPAKVGIVAAHLVTGDSAIAELLDLTQDVQAGSSSSIIRTFTLPSDYRSRLNNAILLTASGNSTVIDAVNEASRNRTQTIGSENRAPAISGTPANSVEADTAYTFTPTASDPDGDTLSFTITNLPIWASFDSTNGTLSGAPGASDVGDYAGIFIDVSDGALMSSIGPFSINVFTDNAPPVISGTPASSVAAGAAYAFAPTATDPNDDVLTFSIVNRPTWLSFDNANGSLTGTPGASDVGNHDDISITVSDGTLQSTLGPFSIDVTATNSPPTIGGTPDAEVTVGNSYSFAPTASDSNGDTLTFSVTGLPSWASFNTSTGAISGTPQSGDVSTYPGIVIMVSDGIANASLGPFTITVQAVSLGSVTLSWGAPTENQDGTPLTDLDGYRIYWGTTPGVYSNSVTIDNESLTVYVVENLAPGTYEFVATSFDMQGVESSYSNPATITIP